MENLFVFYRQNPSVAPWQHKITLSQIGNFCNKNSLDEHKKGPVSGA